MTGEQRIISKDFVRAEFIRKGQWAVVEIPVGEKVELVEASGDPICVRWGDRSVLVPRNEWERAKPAGSG